MDKKNKYNWKKASLDLNATIGDAIKNLISTSLQIVLIVSSNGKLKGTVTDGDIRRTILKGYTLNSKITKIMKTNPFVVTENLDKKTIRYLMKANALLQVPIVDKDHKPIGLHLWNDAFNIKIRNNPVIIMAGGFGRRMKPQTNDTPKPMLKVNNKPILEHIVENIRDCGFKNIIITTHYLSHKITEYFKNGKKWGVNIDYINEKNPLGTAGSLALIKKKISDQILVTNGDVISSVNFSEILEYHKFHKATGTMAVRTYERQNPFGVVESDGINVKKIVEKPTSKTIINAGIYVINSNQIKNIKKNNYYKMTDLFLNMRKKGKKVIVFPMHESWKDIGRPEDIEVTKLSNKK